MSQTGRHVLQDSVSLMFFYLPQLHLRELPQYCASLRPHSITCEALVLHHLFCGYRLHSFLSLSSFVSLLFASNAFEMLKDCFIWNK